MLKRTALPIAVPIALVLAVAACSSAGVGPTGSPGPSSGAAETPRATPTAVPGQGGSGPGDSGGGTDPGTGGGSGGNTGSGILPPGITFPLPDNPDEVLLGQANYLDPVKNLINQHSVNVQLVRAVVAGNGDALVDLRWWSGVAPCNQLDSVRVVRDEAARTVHLTVVEGSAPGDQMCIEIAELHATAVNLGVLASGTWTISAEGDAPAIKLDVP